MSEIYNIYTSSPRPSMKHKNYFQIYENLFSDFKNKNVIFVEIGVLDGGSLFMWREYFGPSARIIGVDLNPAAKKWEDFGFEIHIGDQSDSAFWKTLIAALGNIDVLLDDGGHTNNQQITTLVEVLPFINDGGLVVVEDTHTSYQEEFGNPSKASFNEFCKMGIDSMQARFPGLKIPPSLFTSTVWSISFFESITALHIDRSLCRMNSPVANNGILLADESNADFRYHSDSRSLQLIKLIRKISALDYKSVGGTRKSLRLFNFIFRNRFYLVLFKCTLYPIRFLMDALLITNLNLKNRTQLKKAKKFFSV